MNLRAAFVTSLLAAFLGVAFPGSALAQTAASADGFPSRPVRFIVPFAAGGAVDILTRTVGQKLSEAWGQPVVIDNRPGAGGTIGTEAAARASADGYTVLMGDAAHVNAVWLYKKLSYNFVKDFKPVTVAAITPLVVVTHPSLPVKSTGDLIKLARASKEPLLLGTGGNGSATDLGAELLMATAKIKFAKVQYKSVPPALPLNDATYNLMNTAEFAAMKPGAMLINVSRGNHVNRAALEEVLKNGRLGGYGTDVWWTEPADPKDPLLRDPLVYVTPHIGGETREAIDRMSVAARENIDRFLQGKALLDVVNG